MREPFPPYHARMSRTGSDDLYAILGVSKDASTQDIKKAFRLLARECHPDVAGADPAKLEKFKKIREAYEVLSDPVQRARYDRRGERRTGPFVGSFWNRSGVNVQAEPPAGGRSGRPGNDLDLEDIFNDFGGVGDFGFGRTKAPPPPPRRPGAPPPPPRAEARPPQAPAPGRDVALPVEVPADTADVGGTVTVRYQRLRRADDGRTLYRYDELYDLRVPPGTRSGDTLRVVNMGDAGANGGPYGELVCDVRVVGSRKEPPRMKMPRREEAPAGAEAAPADGETVRVDVGVAEAILGGRVQIPTPTGLVRVTIPPGTSSGTRMRLRGRGNPGADGAPADLFAEVRIVVPRELDEESRRLIERFAELNPSVEPDRA